MGLTKEQRHARAMHLADGRAKARSLLADGMHFLDVAKALQKDGYDISRERVRQIAALAEKRSS